MHQNDARADEADDGENDEEEPIEHHADKHPVGVNLQAAVDRSRSAARSRGAARRVPSARRVSPAHLVVAIFLLEQLRYKLEIFERFEHRRRVVELLNARLGAVGGADRTDAALAMRGVARDAMLVVIEDDALAATIAAIVDLPQRVAILKGGTPHEKEARQPAQEDRLCAFAHRVGRRLSKVQLERCKRAHKRRPTSRDTHKPPSRSQTSRP